MTSIKKLIKPDPDADQSITVDNSGAHGDVWLMINNKSVNFEFSASTQTYFEPAQYEDGYLVYDEEFYVTDVDIEDLAAITAVVTINGRQYDCKYAPTDSDRQRVSAIILGMIINTDDDLDLKQARFDDAYAMAG